MTRKQQPRPSTKSRKLLTGLPPLDAVLRGSLLERQTFHPSTVSCATCASGAGHLQWAIAQDKRIVEGRRLRVDTTVVETNIHHPTDGSLMGDGVRVLTRLMKRITEIAGAVGTQLRDRTRSVNLRVMEIERASRSERAGTGEDEGSV